jgi:hypothetical protein
MPGCFELSSQANETKPTPGEANLAPDLEQIQPIAIKNNN